MACSTHQRRQTFRSHGLHRLLCLHRSHRSHGRIRCVDIVMEAHYKKRTSDILRFRSENPETAGNFSRSLSFVRSWRCNNPPIVDATKNLLSHTSRPSLCVPITSSTYRRSFAFRFTRMYSHPTMHSPVLRCSFTSGHSTAVTRSMQKQKRLQNGVCQLYNSIT